MWLKNTIRCGVRPNGPLMAMQKVQPFRDAGGNIIYYVDQAVKGARPIAPERIIYTLSVGQEALTGNPRGHLTAAFYRKLPLLHLFRPRPPFHDRPPPIDPTPQPCQPSHLDSPVGAPLKRTR